MHAHSLCAGDHLCFLRSHYSWMEAWNSVINSAPPRKLSAIPPPMKNAAQWVKAQHLGNAFKRSFNCVDTKRTVQGGLLIGKRSKHKGSALIHFQLRIRLASFYFWNTCPFYFPSVRGNTPTPSQSTDDPFFVSQSNNRDSVNVPLKKYIC